MNKNTERLERKIYDLKNLIGLGISLSSNLEFESLVESILYSCIGQMFVEKVAILLQIDIDVQSFYIHMVKGYSSDYENSGIILEEKSELVKFLEKNPYPIDSETISKQPELKHDLEKFQYLDPKLIVPMKSKNSLNGIIILGEKLIGNDFSPDEKEFMQDLAKFAAIAVENSRLYLMATLDRMTRLYIHHYFQERLTEEIKRSQRNKTPLSLIMCDIDHFKKFNDTYGHQQGDMVLKETAKLFKQYLRTIDIAARYGGEEFTVILPETKLDDAVTIANRLKNAVENYKYQGQDTPLHVTISLGVAQYMPDKEDIDNKIFIERADSALYKAKKNGRNKVVAYK